MREALQRCAPTLEALWPRLQQLTDWERAERSRMRVDLEPERDLLARLGQPQRRFKSVHVGGTKGKGSVCALIEAGLLAAGLRTGRYASPHIEHVTERVNLNGQPVSEPVLAEALRHALSARDAAAAAASPGRHASWFDVVTAAAFWAFARAGIEWAVVEVGLGGLLDSTNVLQPELCVLTNVELEHTEILGRSVEAIAAQKAGIVKHGCPIVTPMSPSSPAGRVVAEAAAACGADHRWIDLAPTPGVHARNRLLACAALARLGELGVTSAVRGLPLRAEDLSIGLAATTQLPGRLEPFDLVTARDGKTRVLLDGAHVAFSIDAVFEELRLDPVYAGQAVVLLALAPDKDARAFIERLAPHAARLICTQLPDAKPCRSAAELARIARQAGLQAEAVDSPTEAFNAALSRLAEGEWLLATGSLHLAGGLRSLLRNGAVAKPRGD
ncbi:MAG: hypothetical protein KGM91_25125 [Burkholderiales bacterium]|nr:hypothetical protein [Burkholderiales bacterium]